MALQTFNKLKQQTMAHSACQSELSASALPHGKQQRTPWRCALCQHRTCSPPVGDRPSSLLSARSSPSILHNTASLVTLLVNSASPNHATLSTKSPCTALLQNNGSLMWQKSAALWASTCSTPAADASNALFTCKPKRKRGRQSCCAHGIAHAQALRLNSSTSHFVPHAKTSCSQQRTSKRTSSS